MAVQLQVVRRNEAQLAPLKKHDPGDLVRCRCRWNGSEGSLSLGVVVLKERPCLRESKWLWQR